MSEAMAIGTNGLKPVVMERYHKCGCVTTRCLSIGTGCSLGPGQCRSCGDKSLLIEKCPLHFQSPGAPSITVKRTAYYY